MVSSSLGLTQEEGGVCRVVCYEFVDQLIDAIVGMRESHECERKFSVEGAPRKFGAGAGGLSCLKHADRLYPVARF